MTVPRPAWIDCNGPDQDVVVASRCRIARNVAGFPFPWRASELQRKEIAGLVRDAAARGGGPLASAEQIASSGLADSVASSLIEWRYASRAWAEPLANRWLLVGGDARTSLLVNEEDHLRLQVIEPGLQVESSTEKARDAERRLAASLNFWHDPEIGYLTASLVNAGTGLRVSALLHLAGLAASGARQQILDAASQVGCAVRGLYGEGTEGTGEFFQVSNTGTCGTDPARTVARVAAAAGYLVAAERGSRRTLFGGPSDRARLARATEDALRCLFREEAAPRRLLPLVSVLRLAAAEGLIAADIGAASEWVAIAGADAADPLQGDRGLERYAAIRRTSALRQRLRALVRSSGTISTGFAEGLS